jgi:murein DD-endopeptidase MepM/ murein hydrolase activator NlpD
VLLAVFAGSATTLASMRPPSSARSFRVVLALCALSVSAVSAAPVSAAPAASSASASSTPDWAWPVAPPRTIVRPFIAPESEYGPGHRGIDIASTAGTDIRSPSDGVVHFSGLVAGRPVLSIEHAGALISSFEPVVSGLTEGTLVHRGDLVGVLAPDHCDRVCLHFGVRLHGQYVSPLNYLGGVARSILLPTRGFR